LISVKVGDIFQSEAQTLVNTVNCVGVMGKGLALLFKERFPDMYEDYVRRCAGHTVRLGEPYLYRRITPPNIINFPTKDHWRSVSRLTDIVKGLQYLKGHIQEWGVTSLAVPPLGCGEGRLEWRVVGPTLYRHLASLEIPIQLFGRSLIVEMNIGEICALRNSQWCDAANHESHNSDNVRLSFWQGCP